MAIAAGLSASVQAQAPMTREDMAHFLRTAKVVASKGLDKGVTHPARLTLSDGTTTHDGAFSRVDEHQSIMRFERGRTELDFVDSYRYTLAAYGLAGLLGLADMMPVTVERKWDGDTGALSWWIDDVQFDEGERLKRRVSPPDRESWNRQMYRMRVFSQLVSDTDRNVGNVLVGRDWKLWMIDFTRAFRNNNQLLAPGDLTRCDRALLAAAPRADEGYRRRSHPPVPRTPEVEAVLARRDRIVALVEKASPSTANQPCSTQGPEGPFWRTLMPKGLVGSPARRFCSACRPSAPRRPLRPPSPGSNWWT